MVKPRMRTRGKLTKLTVTLAQYEEAKDYGTPKKTGGGYQDVFAEIARLTSVTSGTHVTQVYDDDLNKMRKWAGRADEGSYQKWCRDVLTANGVSWP